MAGETIRDVVMRVRMEVDEASARSAASRMRSAGGSVSSGGSVGATAAGGMRSDGLEERQERERVKWATVRSRALISYIQTQEKQRRDMLAGFVAEKREEEALEKMRARRAAAEQVAARQSLANQRAEIERIGRLAEGIGNVARAFTFLGASAAQSMEAALRAIMAVEAGIRGVQGALQVGQSIREGFANIRGGAARGIASGVAGGAAGGAAGGMVNGVLMRGAAGAVAGGAAGSGAAGGGAAAFSIGAGAAVAAPIAATAALIGYGFYTTHQERLEKDEIQRQLLDPRNRNRRRAGTIFTQPGTIDAELMAGINRDRDARDIRDARMAAIRSEDPFFAARMQMRDLRFDQRFDLEQRSGRGQISARQTEIAGLRREMRGVRGQFVEAQGVGRGADNLDRQAQLQERILGIMRQQVATARDIASAETARIRTAQSAINNEAERRERLKAFVGGLEPGQKAVLQRLNAKAAAGQELTRAEEMQLQDVGGGMFDQFIANRRARRVNNEELAANVGGFQLVGEKIGGPNDELQKLNEQLANAKEREVKAFQEAAKLQKAEADEMTKLVDVMNQAMAIRKELLAQMVKLEAEQAANERAKANQPKGFWN